MFGREPALVIGLIGALVTLAVGFGLPVTPEQVGLINAFVIAAVSFATRTQVTPASNALGEEGYLGALAHKVEDAIEHSKEKGQSAVSILLIVLLVLVIFFVADRLF